MTPPEGYPMGSATMPTDILESYRSNFRIPEGPDGRPLSYFTGNSLGLMPTAAPESIHEVLEDWARLGVDGHFHASRPWYNYAELVAATLAPLIGAHPTEVAVMNSLTVNLHLMLASFWQPQGRRRKILIERDAFPSDRFAVESHVMVRGLDPSDVVVILEPDLDSDTSVGASEVERYLGVHGGEVALVLLGGVHYLTGRRLDLPRIVDAAHAVGAVAGFDLAHAIGNVPLSLHEWDVDFAVWCSYKYLNGGPGAVGGAFVHQRHGETVDRRRLAGWWGNDPETRFRMDEHPHFVAAAGARGWQLSTPQTLAIAPLRVSLEIFAAAKFEVLRSKSVALTNLLESSLRKELGDRLVLLTPHDPEQRGCQLSLRAPGNGRRVCAALKARGVVVDFRPPDVIRMAPVPLYNPIDELPTAAKLVAETWNA